MLLLSLGTCAQAAPVLIGQPSALATNQDCVPFGCAVRAQFIYDASYFAAPIAIIELSFFNSDGGGDLFDVATYYITLSTTNASVSSPSATFADNVGGDAQSFAVAGLSGPVPPAIVFPGTPFNYNPANGNLLLDIRKVGGTDPRTAFTDINNGSGFLVSQVFSFVDNALGGEIDLNYGPVTEFRSVDALQAVPEPATLALTGLSLLALGRLTARKRRTNPA